MLWFLKANPFREGGTKNPHVFNFSIHGKKIYEFTNPVEEFKEAQDNFRTLFDGYLVKRRPLTEKCKRNIKQKILNGFERADPSHASTVNAVVSEKGEGLFRAYSSDYDTDAEGKTPEEAMASLEKAVIQDQVPDEEGNTITKANKPHTFVNDNLGFLFHLLIEEVQNGNRYQYCQTCSSPFYVHPRKPDGKYCSRRCKNRLITSTWRKRNPEKYKKYMRQLMRQRSQN